jgi:Flp pilus assembly protein TadG
MMRKLVGFFRRGGRLRDETGQALIEFSMVLMMMILLIVALVDFARVFMQFQVVTDAAREGARQAVLADPLVTSDSVSAVVLSALSTAGIDLAGASTSENCAYPAAGATTVNVYSCNWGSTVSGQEVRVGIAVPYEFALLGTFIGWTTGDRKVTLRTSISMRNE